MIVALLLSLLLTTASGVMVYGARKGGLLAPLLSNNEALEETMAEVHEVLANFTLPLVILHAGGVVLGMVRHRENLIGAMWHGCKRLEDPVPSAQGMPGAAAGSRRGRR
jgi:cytochrome b